jgi:phytoene/squalene synthetase
MGRAYLPREDQQLFGNPSLDRPSPQLRELLEYEAARAMWFLRSGDDLRGLIGGRIGRAVALFARGGLAALDALERADWDIFTQRPRPSRTRLALAAFAR